MKKRELNGDIEYEYCMSSFLFGCLTVLSLLTFITMLSDASHISDVYLCRFFFLVIHLYSSLGIKLHMLCCYAVFDPELTF